MMNDLIARWEGLNCQYLPPAAVIETEWKLIYKQYTKKSRAYHNFSHLQAMFSEFDKYKDHLIDPDIVEYSIWFHDVIYNVTKQNNEQKSAEIAKSYLNKIGAEAKRVGECYNQIISTKSHIISKNVTNDLDNSFLLDFDLEVMGRSWTEYQVYTEQVRKEYRIYPTRIYNRGRREAMIHFLETPKIYSTKIYQDIYEKQARSNIRQEIKLLS